MTCQYCDFTARTLESDPHDGALLLNKEWSLTVEPECTNLDGSHYPPRIEGDFVEDSAYGTGVTSGVHIPIHFCPMCGRKLTP